MHEGPLRGPRRLVFALLKSKPRAPRRIEAGLHRRQHKSHKTRLPRARGTARKGILPNMTSIHLRPPEVAARIVPGHSEGDLIKGPMNRSSVGTLVERNSRYVMLVKLDGGTRGHPRGLQSSPQKSP